MDELENNNQEPLEIKEEEQSLTTEKSVELNDLYHEEPIKQKKKDKKKFGLVSLISVAIITAMFASVISFALFTYIAPGIFETQDNDNTQLTNVVKTYQIDEVESISVAVSKEVGPSVVGIKTTATYQDFVFGSGESVGEGSGIIIAEDGYIITNNHVIESALTSNSNILNENSKIEVTLPGDIDKTYLATVVGRSTAQDIAVLKIDASGLPIVTLGDSDAIEVGEIAIAIGNPGGSSFMGSITQGIVSGINRTLDGYDGVLVQTDAAINPGNSGGPLLNSKGEVIGINTVKMMGSGYGEVYEGLGFAIPINDVKLIADGLIEKGFIETNTPWMGITIASEYSEYYAEKYGWPMGIFVDEVTFLSPAYEAGLKAHDIITEFDGVKIESFEELKEGLANQEIGEIVILEVYRDDETIELELEIASKKV